MAWFWDDPDDDKSKDPLRGLDPALREFLAKESPVKYKSSDPPATTPQRTTTSPTEKTPKDSLREPLAIGSSAKNDEEPVVPPQSLYQDGRYAHLWKTYRLQSEIEQEGKSDQEKINDVIQGYNARKAGIGRAALESCALEQWDVNECFRSGGWASRMTMCRTENRRLDRCFVMQAKFLKALGYMSTYDRPPEVDERIQLHADTLYHRMLGQENAIEAAKAEGKPIPSFPPLLSSKPNNTKSPVPAERIKVSDLKESVQAKLKKRLEGLSEAERELEERAITAELQAGVQVAQNLSVVYRQQDAERKVRKEQGRETFGDKLIAWFRVW